MPFTETDPNDPAYWRKPHDTYDLDAPPDRDTWQRIGWLMFVIGWSSNELARTLDIAPESARGWVAGRRAIPTPVRDWLEDLAGYHLQHRLPPDWKSVPGQLQRTRRFGLGSFVE